MHTKALRLVTPGPALSEGLQIGTVLKNTYRIVRGLAEGGFGEVYVARHARLSCDVAVKVLHRSLVGDVRAMTRFRREAEVTSALRHPHIVQILDFDVTDQGVPYLVMELLDGTLLSERLIPNTPLPASNALEVIEQIAEALQAAHDRGVVHRDLKPENVILIQVDGRDFVKVVDFGISRASWQARLTGESIVAGTPLYMSPEQARGFGGVIDHRADQFALAAMAYRLLTGCDPFGGDEALAVLYQVVNEVPPPPSELAPGLGPAVDAVIARGMSKRGEDRYPSIRAFAAALKESLGESAPPPVRTSEPGADAAVSPAAGREPLDALVPIVTRPGRITRRLIRRTRRKIRVRRSGSVLLVLSIVLAFAWFCPATRDRTRGAWHRVQADAARLIEAGQARLGR